MGIGAGSGWPAAYRGKPASRGGSATALPTPGSRTGPPSSRTPALGSSVLYGPAQPPELPARVRGQGDEGDHSPDTPEPQPPAPGPRNPPESPDGVREGTGKEGERTPGAGQGTLGAVRERSRSFGGSFGFVSQMMGNSWAGRALPQPPPGVSPPRGSQPLVARSLGTESPSPASHAASLVLDTAPAPHPPGGRIRGLAELSQLRAAERPRAGHGAGLGGLRKVWNGAGRAVPPWLLHTGGSEPRGDGGAMWGAATVPRGQYQGPSQSQWPR